MHISKACIVAVPLLFLANKISVETLDVEDAL